MESSGLALTHCGMEEFLFRPVSPRTRGLLAVYNSTFDATSAELIPGIITVRVIKMVAHLEGSGQEAEPHLHPALVP